MIKNKLLAMVPAYLPELNTFFKSPRDADKARVIFQYMFYMRQLKQTESNLLPALQGQRWVPVQAENLKQMIRDYPRILREMQALNLIEVKTNTEGKASYYPKKYTKLFRCVFSQDVLADKERYRRDYITTPELIESVGRYHKKRYEKQKAILLSHTPWYKPAIEMLDNLYLEVDGNKLRAEHPETFEDLMSTAEIFNNGTMRYIHRDTYGRRIHSHFCSLPKRLRPYLRLKGYDGKLVMLDVKCSQPYFLSIIFSKPEILNLRPELRPLIPVIKSMPDSGTIRLFVQDCVTGTIYDKLAEAAGLERAEMKDLLYKHVLFASPYKHRDNLELGAERLRMRSLFATFYPDALNHLDALKRTSLKLLPDVDTSSMKRYALPNMMAQRVESAVLLDGVTKRILESQVPTCTIHDSWLLKENDFKFFTKTVGNFIKQIGILEPLFHAGVLT